MSGATSSENRAVALVTMGGQAQVVTLAVDALLAHGMTLTSVLVLHLSPADPRVRRALAQLSVEFAGERYQGRPLVFRHVALQVAGEPLPAIRTAPEAEGVWGLARDLLAELKRGGLPLHLCIAGGPRLLALTLTSAAMLQCNHQDRLWHLYTPREFLDQARDGAILHAPPAAGVGLVAVPLVPWGAYFPALRALAQPVAQARASLDPADAISCAAAWGRLTERQREVVQALAEGLAPQAAAEQLGISLKTLDTHKTLILAECRVAWGLPEDHRLTYHFLRDKFGPWVAIRASAR
ncbi:MAG: LuxR C-terminal-related transcriptional regulator [Chloroflexi bacterium]|nr:LuxR C-terminal-related transcriptional regulator [Chloroflexota bacterium]MBU1749958.1 LuxR C-terminal-related transcriptional regulator [Chloroflexota bacterium]